MPLEVKMHGGSPKFSGTNVIGQRIFDLTLAARVPVGTAVHTLTSNIQNEARALVPRAHVLPLAQVHVTVVNPVFLMEGQQVLPAADKQSKLFAKFVEVLNSAVVRQVLGVPLQVSFREILVRQRDIKLMADQNAANPLSSLQLNLAEILRQADTRFDFAEGHPSCHTTLLRFGPDLTEADHSIVLDIIRKAAANSEPHALSMTLRPEDYVAVRFDGLFMPWAEEASVLP